MAASSARVDLDGNTINPFTICMIGVGGFIGSHLCEKFLTETPHTVLAVDVYNDKIKHLLEGPDSLPWAGRIQFHRLNIKNDSRLEAEGAENGLEFTIVRPFNWMGPRMDFIPGIDGPSEGVPRVLACFSNNLLRREPLKLVDGGESQRTFVYIKDAIEAVLLMIENPARANGHIFNVGNPNNEVTVRQLAEMMTKVDSFAYLPPNSKHHFESYESSTLVVFEKRYAYLEDHIPEPIVGSTN
uniref:NAD-dependent epimerase/dehydratase domain-containing protein n=1 Tax=Lactuca sativa TaxID=4236 RepID=A0A9R1W4N8_LACSA|nr:hypothetical protein LSAT_V11C300143300 [Lactuca sativa]